MNFDNNLGMFYMIKPFYCGADDPNKFYGCNYPDIWKMSSGATAGIFLAALWLIAILAKKRSPFAKTGYTVPVQMPHTRLQSVREDSEEDDIEKLQIIMLQ